MMPSACPYECLYGCPSRKGMRETENMSNRAEIANASPQGSAVHAAVTPAASTERNTSPWDERVRNRVHAAGCGCGPLTLFSLPMQTSFKEVPIRSPRAAYEQAKRRRDLAEYVARSRALRAPTFVRSYYRAPRRPPPRPWRDLLEMAVLVPLGLVLAGYCMVVGFGS